jgi:hypothetical protein
MNTPRLRLHPGYDPELPLPYSVQGPPVHIFHTKRAAADRTAALLQHLDEILSVFDHQHYVTPTPAPQDFAPTPNNDELLGELKWPTSYEI